MKSFRICCVVVTLFILSLVVEAERFEDNVEGFSPGLVRRALVQELEDRDWIFNSSKRYGDGMEVVQVSGKSLRFWIDSNKVIVVGGDIVRFKGNEICVKGQISGLEEGQSSSKSHLLRNPSTALFGPSGAAVWSGGVPSSSGVCW